MEVIVKRSQGGFTLIELMIVVAIIGILAALASSQYRAYIARSQAARAMGETGSLKSAFEDCVLNGKFAFGTSDGQCNPLATGSSILGGAPNVGSVPAGTGAPFVSFDADHSGAGKIESTFGNKASSLVLGKKIRWERTADGTWTCRSDVEENYLPRGCIAE